MDWTEITITVSADDLDRAADIAHMAVPYGIYVEDYRNLEQEAREIARIDLIDEELLAKDRSKGLIHLYISPEENPAEASAFLSELYKRSGISFSVDTKLCKNEDWENNWKAYFKPFPIGEKLFIRPVWESVDEAGGRIVLNIEPGLAFGNGGHETTKLCLEALEGLVTAESEVLDVGCGSGILGVAALLLGAKSSTGVDIDKLAVKTAIENGRLNGLSAPDYNIALGDLTQNVSGKYDLILANIVADAVIILSGQIRRFLKPEGVFVTSGIIVQREDEVLKAFAENDLKVTKRHEDNGWLCFECTGN